MRLHAQACAGGDGLGPKKTDGVIRSLRRYPEELGARDAVPAARPSDHAALSHRFGSSAPRFTCEGAMNVEFT